MVNSATILFKYQMDKQQRKCFNICPVFMQHSYIPDEIICAVWKASQLFYQINENVLTCVQYLCNTIIFLLRSYVLFGKLPNYSTKSAWLFLCDTNWAGERGGWLGWPLANRRGGSWTRRHRELDRQLVLSPLLSSPRSRFWPEGRIVGHLGEMGLDKRLVLIPLVQGPAFDQLTTWRGRPFLLKIGLREQFRISARKRSLPSRGNRNGATREKDMRLDRQLVLSGLTSSTS